MIVVEKTNNENRLLGSLLQTLEAEGFVTVTGEDEEEMGETTLHYKLIHYLFTALEIFLQKRGDCFIAANLRLSYDADNPHKWYAPDILIAFGVSLTERSGYNLAEEKIMPQVIIEVASAQTFDNDLGRKYADYARLGVEEYYLLDAERSYLPVPLMAYQRQNGLLVQVPTFDGRVHSPRLDLEIVDDGNTFRLFNPATKQFLLSADELAARVAELEALLKLKHNP